MSIADEVQATLEAGRDATAAALRALADQIERLPMEDVGEALAWLEPHLQRLWREAERIVRGEAGR